MKFYTTMYLHILREAYERAGGEPRSKGKMIARGAIVIVGNVICISRKTRLGSGDLVSDMMRWRRAQNS